MTSDQELMLRNLVGELLEQEPPYSILLSEFHHGGCIGADEEAHASIRREFPEMRIVVHPGVNGKGMPEKRGKFQGAWKVLAARPYLYRNTDIVRGTDCLIATPSSSAEQLRSGTWATVRRARNTGKRVYLVHPDGVVDTEN